MADTKISALTAAATPLAGTEVLPIVQSSTTKKVAVSDLTAGRSVSAASLSLTTTPLAVTSGGTGLATLAQGDLLYGSASNTLSALAKNTTATRYLANTGISNNPAWAQVDLTNGVTGTLPTTNGGTGLTSFTANGIVYASSTSALATGSALTWDGSGLSTTGYAQVAYTTGTTDRYTQIYNKTGSDSVSYATIRGAVGAGLSANLRPIMLEGSTVSFAVGSTGGTSSTVSLKVHNSGGVSVGTTDPGAGNLNIDNGNLVIGTSGKGIDFSANTHAAGMTSELLTWYEEGTFTPTVAFGGASTGITYGTPRIGRYTRIGRMVYIQLYIVLTSKGSSTGSATITGLPFTSDSTTGVRGGASFSINYNVTFADQVYGVILNNTSAISLYQTTNAGALSTITNTNFANDSEFSMIASYQV